MLYLTTPPSDKTPAGVHGHRVHVGIFFFFYSLGVESSFTQYYPVQLGTTLNNDYNNNNDTKTSVINYISIVTNKRFDGECR